MIVDLCGQTTCTNEAQWRVTWPTCAVPLLMCDGCAKKCREVAGNLGFSVPMESLEEVRARALVVSKADETIERFIDTAEAELASCLHPGSPMKVTRRDVAVWCNVCGAARFPAGNGELTSWIQPHWRLRLARLLVQQ